MKRQPSPYQTFKKTLAPYFYRDGVSRDFDKKEARYMQRVFKHFKPEYHDAIANYPNWIRKDRASAVIRDEVEALLPDYEAAFKHLCSYQSIERYLVAIQA